MNVLIDFIQSNDWIWDKWELINKIIDNFKFTKDRSVYYNENLAIRFCYSASWSFSNTVLSLSNLKKYDNMPKYCYVHHKRMGFTDDGKTDSIEYAHFVWQKGVSWAYTRLYLI